MAPWVRTRLRTAPGTAVALAVLVLFTAFLAAAFPRAVDASGTDGLRREIAGAPASGTVLQLTAPLSGVETPESALVEAVRPDALGELHRRAAARVGEQLPLDRGESAYGVRTGESLTATDPGLPSPDGLPPRFTPFTQNALGAHATVRSGRLPSAAPATDAGTGEAEAAGETEEVEAAVTTDTARVLRLRTGSVLHLHDPYGTPALTVRVTGVVEPHDPEGSYWSAETLLRTPGQSADASKPPKFRWEAGLLLAPGAAPALLGVQAGPQAYWRFAPDAGQLTASDAPELSRGIASFETGTGLLRLREIAGGYATVETGLGKIVAGHVATSGEIGRVVMVAAVGTGAVAAVVLVMAAGLLAAGRAAELALLRSRGGSLAAIGGRLLAETAVIALPAAGAGLLLAVVTVRAPGGETTLRPAVYAAIAVALLTCAAFPLRAVAPLRGVRAYGGGAYGAGSGGSGGRDDLATARPSRRRTVAELTLLVLAAASVETLRRRGTGTGTADPLLLAAPVLVALMAALLLVRLYPLPLRYAARPVARLRGAVGFLALARAGRASAATTALPLLALLIALTTAAFGGSVLAGITEARDRAALLAVGADARITVPGAVAGLPAGAAEAVGAVDGVQEVTPIRGDQTARPEGEGKAFPLIGVDPAAYARLAARLDLGAFPAETLTGGPVREGTPEGEGDPVRGGGPVRDGAPDGEGDPVGEGGPVREGTPLPEVTPVREGTPLQEGTPLREGTPRTKTGQGPEVLNAVASPSVAERLGAGEHRIASAVGEITVRVTAVRAHTPAAPRSDFLLVDAAALTPGPPTGLLVTGEHLSGKELRAAIGGTHPPEVTVRSEERAAFTASPLQAGAERVYAAAVAAGAAYAALTLLLALLHAAPERTALLARLRAMGLTTRQGRLLLTLETLPQALLAAGGGILVGWATVRLLGPGVDLAQLALPHDGLAQTAPEAGVPLHTDGRSLLLPAAGVLLLAGAVAAGQAWWAGRRGTVTELRAGETR
ncbi:FtsX-like permease family protein [Streptomyces sp. NPDC093085]|uniref:FtsX-like permease family protein n=1 Tax=Streptomyces sp. NPDC093085 TaxID=3155068 RepID=UPI00343F1F6B